MRTVYIPPYLEDGRTGDVVVFHVDVAKNPHMRPYWDTPEWVRDAAARQDIPVDKLMDRAMTVVSKLPLTAGIIDGINESRARLAQEYGMVDVRLIGDDPNAKPSRKGRNNEELLRVAAQHTDVLRGQLPSEDAVVLSQASSGYTRERMARADAEVAASAERVQVATPKPGKTSARNRLNREVVDDGQEHLGA